MEKAILLVPLLLAVLAVPFGAENIEIPTSAPLVPSTFNLNAENTTDIEESSKLLNVVDNYLTDETNSKTNRVQNPLQTYMAQPLHPIYPAYNPRSYFYSEMDPNAMTQANNHIKNTNYLSAVLPVAQAALQAGLKLFARLGLFLMGGATLLVVGGIFTTLICYLTPICTITFNGYDFQKALNKESMKSLMTPEKIATAAALVQDAIGRYQRLQRAVG